MSFPVVTDPEADQAAPVVIVGLMCTYVSPEEGKILLFEQDGQIQRIKATCSVQILSPYRQLCLADFDDGALTRLNRLHNRILMVDLRRSDPAQAQIMDWVVRQLKEGSVATDDVRVHFGHEVATNLPFEQHLTYAWHDIEQVLGQSGDQASS